MNKHSKQNLLHFQCEENRVIEEEFASVFAEEPSVRLFFINEDEAYTDGCNIIIDPATHDAFCDYKALYTAENFMRISHKASKNELLALAMITRGQNIHESLHVLYTNFPGIYQSKNLITLFQKKLVAMISNIIEDAYIENYASLSFEEAWHQMRFCRIVLSFVHKEVISTVERRINDSSETENAWLSLFLNYMILKFIYPFFKLEEPAKCFQAQYDATHMLFEEAVKCLVPNERDAFAYQIYEVLKPFIKDETAFDDSAMKKILPGNRSHWESQSIQKVKRKGKIGFSLQPIKESQVQYEEILKQAEKRIREAVIITEGGKQSTYEASQLDCSTLHNDITIIENHMNPSMNDKAAYHAIVEKNQLLINNLSGRMRKVLKEKYNDVLPKQLFGRKIDSRYLADSKKRYWDKTILEEKFMNLSVVILVDGSASMAGKRHDETLKMLIILHEVLEKNKVNHCIVEHKAIYNEPIVIHNIMVDFKHTRFDKYNLLQYNPNQNTREGVTLKWTEYYLNKHVVEDSKLVLVISDGCPVHDCPNLTYDAPYSIIDTHLSYLQLKRRGIAVIGLALGDCYDELRQIYDNTINCEDITQMTKQLFRVILRQIQKNDG